MKRLLVSIVLLSVAAPVAPGYVPGQATEWEVTSPVLDKVGCEWMMRAYPEGLRKEFMCFTTL